MKPAQQWEPMHEHVSRVTALDDGVWRVDYIRDFIFTPDAPPEYLWTNRTIDPRAVTGAHLYMIPLEQFRYMRNFFAHTCIGFTFADGTNLIYTVEGRQPKGNEYHPGRSSENVHIFATLEYFCGFRHVVRKRGFTRYPILLPNQSIQSLLIASLEESRYTYGTTNHYHPMMNQCTTELVRIINKGLEKPIPWHPGLHLTGLTHRVFAKHGLIDLKQKEIL